MKEVKGSISMAGENMEILMDAGCIRNCIPEVAVKLPSIVSRLCQILQRKGIARHFIRNIRIGDTVAIVDRQTGYTIRLRMEAHAIYIIGIYQRTPKNIAQQIFVLFNEHSFAAVTGKAAA